MSPLVFNYFAVRERVMWRVYLIWFLRQLFGSFLGKTALTLLVIWLLMGYVSVADVWTNVWASHGFSSQYGFWRSAAGSTELAVQLLVPLGLLLLAFLLKDAAQSLRRLIGYLFSLRRPLFNLF